MEQSLCKLKAEEAKTGSNPTVEETTDILGVEFLSPVVCLSPLVDPFIFGSSFSQLPDLLFYFYCFEKELVCVIITFLTKCQPSFCVEYTQANM